ncbi:hypothetical protein [Gaetbulibacter saemankumensis]|uniref:hypothetical protein n=1 Tax=Gaetbulibacter saemankumensis TaxID=311208 RepID=UPI0003F79679|nr:hypothetical protein [Gaetbulibacter saemankumensis]
MKLKLHLCSFLLFFILGNGFLNFSFAQNIQRVRINFTVPEKFNRPLLLSFTKDNTASDNYDYGFEAINYTKYPYDLNWLIGDLKCTAQGVGAFDDSKKYPLWLFMSETDSIEISFDSLENFDSPINLFIYDALLNTYTKINDKAYTNYINKGEYTNRFYLAFKDESSVYANKSLSTNDDILKNMKVKILNSTKELYINSNNTANIKSIQIVNTLGQTVMSQNVNASEIKLSLNNITTNHLIVNIITDLGSISKQFMLL